MEKSKYQYKCIKCQKVSETDQFCQCNNNPYFSYQTLAFDYQKIKNEKLIDFKSNISHGLEKYLPLLPNNSFKYKLGEGNTPLLKLNHFGSAIGLKNLFVKNEMTNPTGCFKDRETSVVINLAAELNKKRVAVVSSGNAAVSAAAYSNLAGIECVCHIPEKTSIGKKKLLGIFGSKFRKLKGEYEEIYHQLVDEIKDDPTIWNITSGINIFREDGDKTIAFEIFEQIGLPEKVIIPIGNGGLLFGVFKGFWELQQLGITDRIPKIIGVQVEGHSPIGEAIRQGKDYVHLDAIPYSIAEGGIAAQESFCSPLVLKALQESAGELVEITDEDLIVSLKQLLRLESFLTEPTSLAPFAALSKIEVKPDEKIVCIATGTAMKNLEEIFDILNGDLNQ